ncbi:MAG TPA: hypothetical protein VLA74_13795 [Nitrososphaeraceae archaeon]|nr:hypothetical protein [Nitrososphaeraceae archaeon]
MLDANSFFISCTFSSGISGCLPLFGLSFNPSIPSSLYLFNQYNPHGLLLCSSSAA